MAEDVFGIVGSVLASTYHVESVLAEGDFGLVYRAHDASLRAPVALELLELPEQNSQQQAAFLQLFRGEAVPLLRLSASLPNVRRTLQVDAFTIGGRLVPYFVFEWLEGVTLARLIEQRKRENLPPITLRKLVRLLTPVARALERAHHSRGPVGPSSIAHGDLGPDNLFIAQEAGEEVVKILNFGLGKLKSVASQLAGRVSQDGSIPLAFTPAYAAPEQWAPQQYGQTGPWTDVWGLALCLVEVMAARTGIEGEPATMMGVALDPRRRPTPRTRGVDLPDAIEAVFERALALEPRTRQRHAGEFWNELLAALDQFELSAQGMLLSAPARAAANSRAPTSPSAWPSAPGPMRAASVSGLSAPHFVPDLELPPPSASRRASGERPVAQPVPAPASVLELDSASMPAALELELDLPADEPRAQRSVSSQRLPAVSANGPRPSSPPAPSSGSMAAVRELQVGAPRPFSRPPPSPDVSASFEVSFVAKVEPPLPAERNLSRRLLPALALLGAALVVSAFSWIYAATAGEVLEIGGQRLGLLSGALLVLALGLAVREVIRTQ